MAEKETWLVNRTFGSGTALQDQPGNVGPCDVNKPKLENTIEMLKNDENQSNGQMGRQAEWQTVDLPKESITGIKKLVKTV